MKRAIHKKGVERRKKPRSKKTTTRTSTAKKSQETCENCSKELSRDERTLFVEEEVGRVFCSEDCITSYFSPEIERLEKEFYRRLSSTDLSADDREKLSHLRWITLQEPDEIWKEKTLTGDYRYTLISEFKPDSRRIWCVCICLFLRGEPSFLYLAFPTQNSAMVNAYRRGERVQKDQFHPSRIPAADGEGHELPPLMMDGLADAWTEDETMRAQLIQERRRDDIPAGEYNLYQSCLEETLESPDEVWGVKMRGPTELQLYHFIREYPEEKPGIWYIVVAKETDDEEQIEILDAFPTRDSNLVDRYRKGEQHVGISEPQTASRTVH